MLTGDSQNPFGQTVLLQPDYMIGAIIIWDTSRGPIPDGWQTCDGTNGTPDLVGLFVKGAAGPGDIGDTGGSSSHTHTFTGDGHNHDIDGAGPLAIADAADWKRVSKTSPAVGTTNLTDGQPPWYKLFYIQRMS